jgi:peptidoglycan hydrolase-like protein with peptidoglycan-binding domain
VDLGQLDPYDSISGVQARLNNLGYGAGEVDGRLNARTERALRQFQRQQKLEITGRIDEKTCDKLRELNGS